MQQYDDLTNTKGVSLLFFWFQVFMIVIVYLFVLSSYYVIKHASQNHDFTLMVYLPVVLGFVVYPVVLYKTRKLFQKEKRLRAVVWVTAWASVIIVGLYFHISQIVSM